MARDPKVPDVPTTGPRFNVYDILSLVTKLDPTRKEREPDVYVFTGRKFDNPINTNS